MHPDHLAFLALELAHDRAREAEARYRWQTDALPPVDEPGAARRSLARLAASVSRGAGTLARRLDRTALDGDTFDGHSSPA